MNDQIFPVTLKIDAGSGIPHDKLDEMTNDLLSELSERYGSELAKPLTQAAPTGTKVGVELAVLGAIALYVGQKFADALIPKIADSLWNWLKGKQKQTEESLKIEMSSGGHKFVLTATMSKAEAVEKVKALLPQAAKQSE